MRSVTHSLPFLLGFFYFFYFFFNLQALLVSCWQLLARLLQELLEISSAFGGNCPHGSVGKGFGSEIEGSRIWKD